MVVLRRQVNGGEISTHERRGTLVVAAKQFHHAVAVTLGLENSPLLDLAELADGAVTGVEDRSGGRVERAGAVFQRSGKEGIEMFEGSRLFDLRFVHRHAEMTNEGLDEAVFHPGQAALGEAAGEARNKVMWQQVLDEYKQAIFHG